MNIQHKLEDYANQRLKKQLLSIRDNGLKGLKNIPDRSLALSTLQIHGLDCGTCVNYLNLSSCKGEELQQAVRLAVYEEYYGIMGICLERIWPLQRMTDPLDARAEITARLNNSVVFLLKPPALFPIKDKPHNARIPIELAHYSRDLSDGFSQSSNFSHMLVDVPFVPSDHLTEVKTDHTFGINDYLAILVPENLMAVAKECFGSYGIPIVSVRSKDRTLVKLPDILTRMHGEKLTSQLMVTVPDYEQALLNLSNQHKKFSLHAVRLYTPYDFMPRILPKAKESVELLNQIGGLVFDTSDNHLWAFASKMFTMSKTKPIINVGLDVAKTHLLVEANKFYENIFEQVKKWKGHYILANYYQTKPLDKMQLAALGSLGVKAYCFRGNSYVLGFDPIHKESVEHIIDGKPIAKDIVMANLAETVRAASYGFFIRKKYQSYLATKQEFMRKSAELERIKEQEQSLYSDLHTYGSGVQSSNK